MVKHNNVIPNGHFHKDWQARIKTWFDQVSSYWSIIAAERNSSKSTAAAAIIVYLKHHRTASSRGV